MLALAEVSCGHSNAEEPMTSQNFSPATTDGTGADRPRRSRGGRGRGGRPAGDQQSQNSPRPQAAPAPVVVPVGADALQIPHPTAPSVLPTDTTFAALGVPAPLVEVLAAVRRHELELAKELPLDALVRRLRFVWSS